jgi:hypothetical protein
MWDVDMLVELIMVCCPPTTVMRSLTRLCRKVAAVIRSRCLATGNTLTQRYWYLLHYHLVWEAPEQDKGRRALVFSLTKDNAKKNWFARYRDELRAHLARTMRGAGCCNNQVSEAKNFLVPTRLSSDLPVVLVDHSSHELAREQLKMREDVLFVDRCIDGGVSPEHFACDQGCTREQFSRAEYRKDPRQGKRTGKHGKGKTSTWSNWHGKGNYEY